MYLQKITNKNACSIFAAAFALPMIYVAVIEGQDVLGVGIDMPTIWTGIVIFAVSIALLMCYTLLEWFNKWLLKPEK